MNAQPLIKVAVVGHTNTGKTSLLRTLTRDAGFGVVSTRPGTTRHVEATQLLADGVPIIELYDTPGIEDAVGLHAELTREGDRADGLERIRRFLASPDATGRYAQEAKVLRQVLESDLLFYVIDARDPVLGRHRDELAVLAMGARPIIPVLNFVASPESREALWRESLARMNLHAVVAFDTVLFDAEGERRLFEKMQTLLDTHYARIERLIQARAAERQAERDAALAAVADLLIDVAALSLRADGSDEQAVAREAERLRRLVREREAAAVTLLLEMFRFRPEDCRASGLPIEGGRWRMDLFSPDTLRRFGISAGSGAAKGAAIGLGVDVLVGGLSLGAAAAVGATIGALWGTLSRFGRRALDYVRGYVELRVDDATLRLLAARQLGLVGVLMRRGHASLEAIELPGDSAEAFATLPRILNEAREHPEWSRLDPELQGRFEDSAARRDAREALQQELARRLAAA